MLGIQRTPFPRRVHVYAYALLHTLCDEIQRGTYPTKATLARLIGRTPRTVQHYLRALVDDFGCPLAFDPCRRGWYFTDTLWRLPLRPTFRASAVPMSGPPPPLA